MGLSFGYNAGLPEDVKAAWGARLIVDQQGYIDFVHDRQDMFGDTADKDALKAFLTEAFPVARERASDLLKSYKMSTRDREEFVLFEDDLGKVVGNTNASAGYLYVCAFLHAHVEASADTSLRPRPGETAEGGARDAEVEGRGGTRGSTRTARSATSSRT